MDRLRQSNYLKPHPTSTHKFNNVFFRLYGIPQCPVIAMTATATAEEVKDVIVSLGLKEAPIVLQASPVQSHIKFSILRRPSNNFGLDGIVSSNDTRKPGLMDLLDRVYLKQYLEDLKRGQKPNKCIIFCRGNGLIGALYGRLMERTGFK